MTINEYLGSLPKMTMNDGKTLAEEMADTVQIWSNDACRGYVILAMEQANCSKEQIKNVLSELRWTFDDNTLEQAEQKYRDYLTC